MESSPASSRTHPEQVSSSTSVLSSNTILAVRGKTYTPLLMYSIQANLPEAEWQNTLLQILQGYLRSRGTSLNEFQLPMLYLALKLLLSSPEVLKWLPPLSA